MKLFSIFAMLTSFGVTAIAQEGSVDPVAGGWCVELNQAAVALARSGRLAEAEASLQAATPSGDEHSHWACRGHILSNIAGVMAVLGRVVEAERLAAEAIRILDKRYAPNDGALLRPLQVLAAIRLESGRTARARDAVARIQLIRIKRPEDSAIVHGTVGALLHIEGRRFEAETEFHDALRALEEA